MKICSICRRCFEDGEDACPTGDHGQLVPARPGSRLIADRYRLDRLLGRGGMGAVYSGTHVELDRPAAIKLLLPDLVADTQALERFRREARAAARLNHPNVADTFDYGILPGGEAYIVMELVEGQTLREFINASGALSFADAVAIARQVSDGIEVAHRNGIVHRDLKPSNIILTRDHHDALQAKVVDFGIAKLKEYSTSGGVLTNTGSLIGTPRYMSPEQCAGHDIDARSDIYSLGVIIYEMLAGVPPFDAPSATAIALKHVQEPPPPLHTLRPDVPEALEQLVMRTLDKEPDGRPQTAGELARELRALENTLEGSHAAHAALSPAGSSSALDTAHDGAHGSSVFSTTSPSNNPPTNSHGEGEPAETGRAGTPTLEDTGAVISAGDALSAGDPVSDSASVSDRDAASVDDAVSDSAAAVSAKHETPESAAQPASAALTENDAASQSAGASGHSAASASQVVPANDAETVTRIAASGSSRATAIDAAGATGESATNAARAAGNFVGGTRESPPPAPSSLHASRASEASAVPFSASAEKRRTLPFLLMLVGVAVAAAVAVWLIGSWRADTAQTDATNANSGAPASNVNAATRPETVNRNSAASTNASPVASPATDEGATTSAEVERRALSTSLERWIAASNARDIGGQMSFYMPRLSTYYRSSNVSRDAVRRDKDAVITQASRVQINVDNPVINLSRDGRTASMEFHKQYTIDGGVGQGSGEVVQELLWQKTPQGWKIISERDKRIIR